MAKFTKLAGTSFTGTDEAPLSEGGLWVTATGETQFNRTSNAAVPSNPGSLDSGSRYTGITWPTNHYTRANLTVNGTGGGSQGLGLKVRQATAAQTFYRFIIDHAANNNATIARFNTGSSTNLVQWTQSFADGDQFTFAVEDQGPGNVALFVYDKNLVLVQKVIDTSASRLLSGVGGIAFSSVETSASLDNFEGGSFISEPSEIVQNIDFGGLDENDFDIASWAGQSLQSWFDEELFVPGGGVSGSIAQTNANDTSSASGTVSGVAGSIAKTNANDTSAASGIVLVTGTIARTNANDTSVASGVVKVTGTISRTNANDTSSAAGVVKVTGTVARTNADDTSSASGTVSGGGISGSVAATAGADTSSASGVVLVTGTIARTNNADASAAAGAVTVTGTISVTDANYTGALAGTVTVSGTVARTNADDTSAASGSVTGAGTITGTVATTNANDTSVASGIVSGVGTDIPVTYYGSGKRKRRTRRDEFTAEDAQKHWELLELRTRQAEAQRKKKAGEIPGAADGAEPHDGESDLPVEAKKPTPKLPVVKTDAASLQVRKVLDEAQARVKRDGELLEAAEEAEEMELMMLMAAAAVEDD